MNSSIFNGKTIALGVSGGIAAYKAVDLASKLTQAGATVKTVMSANATNFVSPLTFQTVTRQPVLTDLFEDESGRIYHVSLSEEADVVVVAPATANILAKAACGIADDALSTTILAARNTIVMVPAMNNYMWCNQATQHNIAVLKERGVLVMEPEVGRLACGDEAVPGRFPETGAILEYLEKLLAGASQLNGTTILITAGGTHEPIDPVRFIGNRSSGKMGYAIAEAARMRGAKVILVTGPTCLEPPAGVNVVRVETALQMHEAVLRELPNSDAVIMAAAVADFRPITASAEKIKKEKMAHSIELELNPDILQSIQQKRGHQIVIGFAAETERMIEHAMNKLARKGLDLIVANDVGQPGVGFGSDLNTAVLIDHDGPRGDIETYRKSELAGKILDWLAEALQDDRSKQK